MVKSNYDIIKELKQTNMFDLMVSNGLVSTSFDAYYNIYEYYLKCIKTTPKKADVIGKISIEFNISERSVYVIINKMK